MSSSSDRRLDATQRVAYESGDGIFPASRSPAFFGIGSPWVIANLASGFEKSVSHQVNRQENLVNMLRSQDTRCWLILPLYRIDFHIRDQPPTQKIRAATELFVHPCAKNRISKARDRVGLFCTFLNIINYQWVSDCACDRVNCSLSPLTKSN